MSASLPYSSIEESFGHNREIPDPTRGAPGENYDRIISEADPRVFSMFEYLPVTTKESLRIVGSKAKVIDDLAIVVVDSSGIKSMYPLTVISRSWGPRGYTSGAYVDRKFWRFLAAMSEIQDVSDISEKISLFMSHAEVMAFDFELVSISEDIVGTSSVSELRLQGPTLPSLFPGLTNSNGPQNTVDGQLRSLLCSVLNIFSHHRYSSNLIGEEVSVSNLIPHTATALYPHVAFSSLSDCLRRRQFMKYMANYPTIVELYDLEITLRRLGGYSCGLKAINMKGLTDGSINHNNRQIGKVITSLDVRRMISRLDKGKEELMWRARFWDLMGDNYRKMYCFSYCYFKLGFGYMRKIQDDLESSEYIQHLRTLTVKRETLPVGQRRRATPLADLVDGNSAFENYFLLRAYTLAGAGLTLHLDPNNEDMRTRSYRWAFSYYLLRMVFPPKMFSPTSNIEEYDDVLRTKISGDAVSGLARDTDAEIFDYASPIYLNARFSEFLGNYRTYFTTQRFDNILSLSTSSARGTFDFINMAEVE